MEIKAEQLRIKGSACPTALAMYAYVWQPRPNKDPNKAPKYSLQMVWPENEPGLAAIKAAIKAAAQKKWGASLPTGLKSPLRVGNKERVDLEGKVDPRYKDKVFMTARSKDKPAVVNALKQPIVNEMEFYSGCMVKVSLSFGAYEQEGSKGVACYLGPIQKIADGERLSGQRDPDDEFDEEQVPGAAGGSVDDVFA